MKRKLPLISVIIPTKPDGDITSAIASLKKINYPSKSFEVILVKGFQPSRQRNEAAKKTRGEVIYFLDNDSQIHKEAFKRVAAAFKGEVLGKADSHRVFSLLPKSLSQLIEKTFFPVRELKGEIGAVGGPNVGLKNETFWSSMAGIILESFFGHYKMGARYRPIGSFRWADEKELILCNLAIKRKVFLKLLGFREELYPNEENEFLNRFAKGGYKAIYHPAILVYRPRRETLLKILKAFFSYGRGRMEQVRIEGIRWSLPLFLPLILFIYLAILFFYHYYWVFLPLSFYFALGFFSALGFAVRRKKTYLAFILPIFFLLVHLTYALGLMKGLFTDLKKKKKNNSSKKIETVFLKKFKGQWIKNV